MSVSLANRVYMAVSKSANFGLVMAQAMTQSVMGLFAGVALILHISTIRFGSGPRVERNREVASITGITPYTSGAATRYSLQNET